MKDKRYTIRLPMKYRKVVKDACKQASRKPANLVAWLIDQFLNGAKK